MSSWRIDITQYGKEGGIVCLAFADRISQRSLIQMRNKVNCVSVGTWGTLALILVNDKTFPFKTTRCFLKLRKSGIVFKMLAHMPFCFNLTMRPLCHTLSNTLYISKNIVDLKIIVKRLIKFMGERKNLINKWIIWFKKPDWLSGIKLFSAKSSNTLFHDSFNDNSGR